MATRGLGLFLFVLQLFVLLSNPATPSTRPSSTPLPPDALCRSIGRSASFLGTGALRLVGGNELELSDVSEEERRRYASSFFNERSGGSRDWNERGRPRRGAPRRYDDSDGWGEKRRDERTDAWGARESGRGGWQSRGQAFSRGRRGWQDGRREGGSFEGGRRRRSRASDEELEPVGRTSTAGSVSAAAGNPAKEVEASKNKLVAGSQRLKTGQRSGVIKTLKKGFGFIRMEKLAGEEQLDVFFEFAEQDSTVLRDVMTGDNVTFLLDNGPNNLVRAYKVSKSLGQLANFRNLPDDIPLEFKGRLPRKLMGPLAWGEESLKAYNAARRERIRRTKAGELTRRKYDSEGFPIGTHKPAPTARRKQTRGRRPRSESQGVDASSALPPLPKGWERRLDPKGRPYYINWEDRSSQWDPPPGYSEPAAIRHVERFDEEGRGSIDDGGEGRGGGRALVENDGGTQEEWGEEAEQADEEGGGRTLQITQNGFNLTEEDKRLLEEEVERLSMESPLWRLAAEANFNLSTLCSSSAGWRALQKAYEEDRRLVQHPDMHKLLLKLEDMPPKEREAWLEREKRAFHKRHAPIIPDSMDEADAANLSITCCNVTVDPIREKDEESVFDELNALSSDDDEGFFRPGALNLPIPESLKGSDFEKMINFFKDNAEEMEELFKLPKNNPRTVRAAREREAYFAGHIARAQKLERGDRNAQSKQAFALQPFSDRLSALESNVSVSHILVKHSQSRRLSSRIDPAGEQIKNRSVEDAMQQVVDMRAALLANATPEAEEEPGESEATERTLERDARKASTSRLQAAFHEMAKARSDCNSGAKGGSLGVVAPGKMPKQFQQAAFDLHVGQLSMAVMSDSGVHLILRTK